MNLVSAYLIGIGIIILIVGLYFLYKHYKTPVSNEKYAWGGYGKNPFKKE